MCKRKSDLIDHMWKRYKVLKKSLQCCYRPNPIIRLTNELIKNCVAKQKYLFTSHLNKEVLKLLAEPAVLRINTSDIRPVQWSGSLCGICFLASTELPVPPPLQRICCHRRLSLWAMACHCHADERAELRHAAGVMLSVRQSDRNANEVSKLTRLCYRRTSGRQWFISRRGWGTRHRVLDS